MEERVTSFVHVEPKYSALHYETDYHYDAELGVSLCEVNHGGGGRSTSSRIS
jgi:hypothetical protein